MTFTTLKLFLCRNDVKIVILCTITGEILQVLSNQYLKGHLEFLEDAPKRNYSPRRLFSLRGGTLMKISGISVKIAAKVVLNFLAKKGLLAGLANGGRHSCE